MDDKEVIARSRELRRQAKAALARAAEIRRRAAESPAETDQAHAVRDEDVGDGSPTG